jgi:uncharacterized protein YpmB
MEWYKIVIGLVVFIVVIGGILLYFGNDKKDYEDWKESLKH